MDAPARTTGLDFLEEFASAAEWFADHVAHVSMRTPVSTCPGWNVFDLVEHLGNVHSWAATIIETANPSDELRDSPPSHRPKQVALWYLAKAEDLYAVLRTADPEAPCWNFAFGSGPTSFWERRQTHETLMHGIDLALAANVDERLPVEVAADGVDEALTVFLHRMHVRGYRADLTRPVVLRATDVGRSWTVHPGPRGEVHHGEVPHQGQAPLVLAGAPDDDGVDVIEAPAPVLMKLLWKRVDPFHPAVRLRGDQDRIMRFLRSRLTA